MAYVDLSHLTPDEYRAHKKAVSNARHKAYRERQKAKGTPHKSGKSGKRKIDAESDPRVRAMMRLQGKRFIAWDSEGVTFPVEGNPQGDHRLVFFANSAGDELENPEGIPDYRVLIPWLFEHSYKYAAHYIHVFFSATYDWTMILRGMKEKDIKRIYDSRGRKGTYLDIDGATYDVRIAFKRALTIRKLIGANVKTGKNVWHTTRFVDTFGFYQSSFITALKANLFDAKGNPLSSFTIDDYNKIESGKLKRSSAPCLDNEMKEYCRAELRALVLLSDQLRDHMVAADIPIRDFWGAGSIAGAMLKWSGMKKYQNPQPTTRERRFEDYFATISPEVPKGHEHYREPAEWCYTDAIIHAFYGGRIEMIQYGHLDSTVYDDDLNSAYPFAMSELPSFHPDHGEWVHRKPEPGELWIKPETLSRFSMVHVWYRWSDSYETRKSVLNTPPFHPFPLREKSGAVMYQCETMGWYHLCEFQSAVIGSAKHPALTPAHCHIDEAFEWIPNATGETLKPWREFIHGKFALRKELTASHGKGGPEKIVKLGINSAYGKTAQRVGWESKKDGSFQLPPYQDLYMAGYITARTRGLLYERACNDPYAVISFATDGLTATRPLVPDGDESIGPNLGQWERTKHDRALFVMAGVYILESTKPDGTKAYKNMARGYHPRMTTREWWDLIMQTWGEGDFVVHLPNTVFHTAGLCVARGKFEPLGQWETVDRKVELSCIGAKRKPTGLKRDANPANGLCRTLPKSHHDRWSGLGEFVRSRDPLILEKYRDHIEVFGATLRPSHPSKAEWLLDIPSELIAESILDCELSESVAVEAERINDLE